MTDGTNLAVQPIHVPLIHGENVFVDHYIHLSNLAALISNPAVLVRVERNPFLRAAVLSNPFLAGEISHNLKLLNILIQNPSLISSILANPKLLTLIKQNPLLLPEIIRNPSFSVEEILQNISERNKSNKPEENIKNIAEKKPTQSQVLHKLKKPIVVMTKVPLAIKEAIAKVGLGERKISINVSNIKIIEGKAQVTIPLIGKQNPRIYIDSKTLAMHPSLLVLLVATAFSASRTKIASKQEELETQTERLLDTLQEIGPIHEVEEASEVHLMKETIA